MQSFLQTWCVALAIGECSSDVQMGQGQKWTNKVTKQECKLNGALYAKVKGSFFSRIMKYWKVCVRAPLLKTFW